MEIFKIVILSLSALLLIYAGASRVMSPLKSFCLKAYAENPDLQLAGKVDLFNEMRGGGSLTIVAGIAILLGTFMPEFRLTSHVVAIVIFFGFALGRLVSRTLDGQPNKELNQGLISEIILGALNSFCLATILI